MRERRSRAIALAGLLCALLFGGEQPASAQLSAQASLTTDYRLRGYSLSRREPAASLSLGYDDKSGLFADATGVVLHTPEGTLRWMGGFASVGYAARIKGDLSADIALLRAEYSSNSTFRRRASYTELSAGLTGRSFAARIAVSPDYLWEGTTTAYMSGEIVKRPADKWRIVGHAGLLAILSGGPSYALSETQYDWSLRVGRQLGHADLEMELTGGGPNREMVDARFRTKTTLVGTLRWAF